MSPKLPPLYICRDPKRRTDSRERSEEESQFKGGTEREITPPGGAKARDGHVTARKTPERSPAKHRKTLLPRLKFSASESRDPRGPRQHAISPQRVRKDPANTGRIRHPLRGGGNACVSPAGTPVGTRAVALAT